MVRELTWRIRSSGLTDAQLEKIADQADGMSGANLQITAENLGKGLVTQIVAKIRSKKILAGFD